MKECDKRNSHTSSKLMAGFRREVDGKTALLWVITQRVVVISYRRFGATY